MLGLPSLYWYCVKQKNLTQPFNSFSLNCPSRIWAYLFLLFVSIMIWRQIPSFYLVLYEPEPLYWPMKITMLFTREMYCFLAILLISEYPCWGVWPMVNRPSETNWWMLRWPYLLYMFWIWVKKRYQSWPTRSSSTYSLNCSFDSIICCKSLTMSYYL